MDIPNIKIPNSDIIVEKGIVYSYPMHTHSHYEITLYEPCSGVVTVNDESFTIDTPSVFLISPSDFHRISIDGPSNSTYIKIGISEKNLKAFTNHLPQNPIVLKKADNIKIISEMFYEIYKTNSETEYVSALINATIRCIMKYGKKINPTVTLKKHELAIKALRYVNENYLTDITLTQIAEKLMVSPQYLSSVFSEENGIGLSAYITELRLKKSVELLKNSQKSITEICYDCGYRNLSYFLRSFKAKYRISPKKYQQLQKTMPTNKK